MTSPAPATGPSLDQRRAQHAARSLDHVLSELTSQDRQQLYRSYIERLGPAILTNGLGQALAAELARGHSARSDPHCLLADQLASWLADEHDGVFRLEEAAAGTLLDALCGACQRTYARAQQEALAWLAWHKRFARARILDDEAPSEATQMPDEDGRDGPAAS
jgi:CRISPR-associated protein Cmr5